MTLSHSGASELAQPMEGTTAGALIPEIVRRGFQDPLEAGVTSPWPFPGCARAASSPTGSSHAAGSTRPSTPW